MTTREDLIMTIRVFDFDKDEFGIKRSIDVSQWSPLNKNATNVAAVHVLNGLCLTFITDIGSTFREYRAYSVQTGRLLWNVEPCFHKYNFVVSNTEVGFADSSSRMLIVDTETGNKVAANKALHYANRASTRRKLTLLRTNNDEFEVYFKKQKVSQERPLLSTPIHVDEAHFVWPNILVMSSVGKSTCIFVATTDPHNRHDGKLYKENRQSTDLVHSASH